MWRRNERKLHTLTIYILLSNGLIIHQFPLWENLNANLQCSKIVYSRTDMAESWVASVCTAEDGGFWALILPGIQAARRGQRVSATGSCRGNNPHVLQTGIGEVTQAARCLCSIARCEIPRQRRQQRFSMDSRWESSHPVSLTALEPASLRLPEPRTMQKRQKRSTMPGAASAFRCFGCTRTWDSLD